MESEIKKLLGLQKQTGEPGRHCPDETQLAAFVAKRLDTPAHAAVEFHLADCDFCLSQLTFLTQSVDAEKIDQVPLPLLARARDIRAKKSKPIVNWGWRWAAPVAAVACLILLVVGVVVRLRNPERNSTGSGSLIAQRTEPVRITSTENTAQPPPVRSETAPQTQAPKPKPGRTEEVRRSSSQGVIPRLVAPPEGAVIERKDLELRWQPVPDAMFYEVRLMSTAGDVVFVEQTENTSLRPGAAASLAPGTKYFVMVSAHLRLGNTQKSEAISFRITGK